MRCGRSRQHFRHMSDIDKQCRQSKENIDQPHDRHQKARDLNDPAAAAGDGQKEQNGRCGACIPAERTAVKREGLKGALKIERGQHIVSDTVSKDQGQSKDNGQKFTFADAFDIERGTAVTAAVRIFSLVDLGKRGLHKSGGTADESREPHPENSPIAAQTDGGRNADDVPGPHPGGGGDHQCAERGNPSLFRRFFKDDPQRFRKKPQLDETCSESEVKTSGNEQHSQRPAGQIHERIV